MGPIIVQSIVNGISLSMLYMLISVGLCVLFGMTNILYMAHGVTYMLGAVLSYYVVVSLGINYFLGILIVLGGMAVYGVGVERIFFRRIRYSALACFVLSLGLIYAIENGTYLFFGLRGRGVPSGMRGAITFLGAVLTYQKLAIIIGSTVLLVALQLFFTRTKYGKAMIAFRQNRLGASLVGIDPNTMAMMAFAIGCALAGAAGILVAPLYYVSPNMGQTAGLQAFLIMGLGGLGSIPGAIIAAFIIGFATAFGSVFLGEMFVRIIVFGLLVILIMIRPRGIRGEVREMEL
jgi:branched-chain amino acid transport system permease protein